MTILTIDVGLLNLGVCCMERNDSNFNLLFWEVINTLGTEPSTCSAQKKKGGVCGKKASFTADNAFFCKTHYTGIETKQVKIKTPKVKDYLLQDIAKKLMTTLDALYTRHQDAFVSLTHIFIELQPKINNKMKFSSHIIYGKLVELFSNTPVKIRFIAARNKLTKYEGPPSIALTKDTYAQRKQIAIQYAMWYLENRTTNRDKWLAFFNGLHKADDAADTFLMAVNALNRNLK